MGDDLGILIEFIYSRTRGNSLGWDVTPLPAGPDQAYQCIGFSVQPSPSNLEQGGEVLTSRFHANIVCLGQQDVNDLEPLRPMARELFTNLQVTKWEPGLDFAGGKILSCTQEMPVSLYDRSEKGRARWMHGNRWLVCVQPDGDLTG